MTNDDVLFWTHEINNAQTILGCCCRRLKKDMTIDEVLFFTEIMKTQIKRIEDAYKTTTPAV